MQFVFGGLQCGVAVMAEMTGCSKPALNVNAGKVAYICQICTHPNFPLIYEAVLFP